MTCTRCRAEFCYACGGDWTPAHYGSALPSAPPSSLARCVSRCVLPHVCMRGVWCVHTQAGLHQGVRLHRQHFTCVCASASVSYTHLTLPTICSV
eukprot:3200469-Rhodomonas_salina.1